MSSDYNTSDGLLVQSSLVTVDIRSKPTMSGMRNMKGKCTVSLEATVDIDSGRYGTPENAAKRQRLS